MSRGALLACVVWAACTPKPVELTIGRIVIDAPARHDSDSQARERLRVQLQQRIENEPQMRWVEARDASHRFRLAVQTPVELDGQQILPVIVRLKGEPEFEVAGRGNPIKPFYEGVLEGLDHLWPVLQAMRRLDVRGHR